MGQAARRGNFEERRAIAITKKEEEEKLDAEYRKRYKPRTTHSPASTVLAIALAGAMGGMHHEPM